MNYHEYLLPFHIRASIHCSDKGNTNSIKIKCIATRHVAARHLNVTVCVVGGGGKGRGGREEWSIMCQKEWSSP